jgi:hypothetical protein
MNYYIGIDAYFDERENAKMQYRIRRRPAILWQIPNDRFLKGRHAFAVDFPDA